MPASLTSRLASWLTRWGPILPLLAAELIVWLGFGALLPIMPLFFRERGVGLETLGVVIAAWPAARLVGEPIFGWVADRTRRVPLMVAGLAVTAVALGLPLVFSGPLEFMFLRALAGLATAAYDPAARGYLTDATPPDRRGEAFGLYGAAQMGGLLLGPAIGGLGASAFGGDAFVFVFGAFSTLIAAAAVAWRVRESAQVGRYGRIAPAYDVSEFPPAAHPHPRSENDAAADAVDATDGPAIDGPARSRPLPQRLWNRWLTAAIAFNLGAFFAGGTYEVIWSVFLESKGAGRDLIGLTFAMFALPVLLVSPLAGRLVDRRGSFRFIVAGALATAIASPLYTVVGDPLQVIPILLAEATGFAILNPALYAVVAAGSPRGRSSTAQGLFGAAGTVGTIVSSVLAGYLADIDLGYPFLLGGATMFACLLAGIAIGGRSLRERAPATQPSDGLITARTV